MQAELDLLRAEGGPGSGGEAAELRAAVRAAEAERDRARQQLNR